ncbi:hypothetical protein PFISCL1PPCAC_28014 [Pristionchus fissidentatus]|uniref:Uncharacterized protein n=1 Tax=Pristionchus fissidentatus TaxID=1538716 RepID=A0AAV5X378_9BILA|nr:hypothetical protein PFISCL1PPCAC_28014 [Pristionchus fissidentatus]
MISSRVVVLLLSILISVHSQTFSTGDNSSVADCTHDCSHKEESRLCLDGNAHFFERLILGHLRYYIATQLSIDLWHKEHKKGEARNVSEIRDEVREGLGLQWTGEKDIITVNMMDSIADLVAERTDEINLRNRTHAPPAHCPIPCEYKYDLYKLVLALSVSLNAILATGVVILFTRLSDKNTHRLLVATDNN